MGREERKYRAQAAAHRSQTRVIRAAGGHLRLAHHRAVAHYKGQGCVPHAELEAKQNEAQNPKP